MEKTDEERKFSIIWELGVHLGDMKGLYKQLTRDMAYGTWTLQHIDLFNEEITYARRLLVLLRHALAKEQKPVATVSPQSSPSAIPQPWRSPTPIPVSPVSPITPPVSTPPPPKLLQFLEGGGWDPFPKYVFPKYICLHPDVCRPAAKPFDWSAVDKETQSRRLEAEKQLELEKKGGTRPDWKTLKSPHAEALKNVVRYNWNNEWDGTPTMMPGTRLQDLQFVVSNKEFRELEEKEKKPPVQPRLKKIQKKLAMEPINISWANSFAPPPLLQRSVQLPSWDEIQAVIKQGNEWIEREKEKQKEGEKDEPPLHDVD